MMGSGASDKLAYSSTNAGAECRCTILEPDHPGRQARNIACAPRWRDATDPSATTARRGRTSSRIPATWSRP